MISIVIAYGLIAMIASGASSAYLKRAIERYGAVEAAALRALVSAVVLLMLLVVFPQSYDFSNTDFYWAFLIALTGYTPFMFFVRALEKGKVGVIVPISAGWIVVASVFGVLFLGEVITLSKGFVVALVLAGILLASFRLSDFKNSSRASLEGGIVFALLSALLWGIVFPLFKIGAALIGALFFAFLVELLVSLSAFVHLVFLRRHIGKIFVTLTHDVNAFRALMIAGVLTSFFTLAMSLGYQSGEISLMSALGGSGIVVSLMVAAYIYRERLTINQYGGAGLVLLGIVLTAII